MAPTKLIIDTDPGNDDMLAMLLALSSKSEEIEVPLISITYGNVDTHNCLRNVVTMFSIIEKEMAWRKANGLPEGFDALKKTKPVVAVGANSPLGDQRIFADFFHGIDGLGGTHETHPHFTPEDSWRHLFDKQIPENTLSKTGPLDDASLPSELFTPSTEISWKLILQILRDNPPNTISIATIGPMTNLALAASEDPVTVMRAKEILVMGGAIRQHGNITPLAEFNTFADAHAAAYVYALTGPNPRSTAPPKVAPGRTFQEGVPHDPEDAPLNDLPLASDLGNERLNVILFPLDLTEQHLMAEKDFNRAAKSCKEKGSPLAAWMDAWVGATLQKVAELDPSKDELEFQLHDPTTVWYALDGERNSSNWTVTRDVDLRVESAGQWTRGACIVDTRVGRVRYEDAIEEGENPGDHGGWFNDAQGNRLGWCVKSPGQHMLSKYLLKTILPSVS